MKNCYVTENGKTTKADVYNDGSIRVGFRLVAQLDKQSIAAVENGYRLVLEKGICIEKHV